MLALLLLASLGLLARAADPQSKSFDCGTDTSHASDSFLDSIAALHDGKKNGSPAARAALIARETSNDTHIEIDVVFHIVAKEESKGTITDDMPSAQLDALNAAYKDAGFSFNLIDVTWNTNDAWAIGAGDSDTEMKKALRKGTYSTLNLYFQTDLAGNLGRCTLPSSVGNGKPVDPKVYFSDGCNVNANTMPAGSMEGYNSGKTAVHETGHWLGLLHTFEGNSCDGPGDYIDDTPQESQYTEGCPTEPPKRTCADTNGGLNDPIHNYMDYSSDDCYEGFTAKQHDRMHHMYNMFRDGH